MSVVICQKDQRGCLGGSGAVWDSLGGVMSSLGDLWALSGYRDFVGDLRAYRPSKYFRHRSETTLQVLFVTDLCAADQIVKAKPTGLLGVCSDAVSFALI